MKVIAIVGLTALLGLGAWGSAHQFRNHGEDGRSSRWESLSGRSRMMARGMMGQEIRRQGMMGRGMMGGMMPARRGDPRMPDFCPQQMDAWSRDDQVSDQISSDDARKIAREYLESIGDPDLRVSRIKDKGKSFEVTVITQKGGALVSTIVIDKATGEIRPKL